MKRCILFCCVFLLSAFAHAQDTPDTTNKASLKPAFNGLIKTSFEYQIAEGLARFNVLNARLDLRGFVNSDLGYQLQVDLSSQGTFTVLDANVRYQPSDKFEVALGQVRVPYTTQKQISPGLNPFTTYSFPSLYMSSRDIGGTVSYRLPDVKKIPLWIYAGMYNGTGINNPEWTGRFAYSARLVAGGAYANRIGIKYYDGSDIEQTSLRMLGFDANYQTRNFETDVEWDTRRVGRLDSLDNRSYAMESSFDIQAKYIFRFEKNYSKKHAVKYIAPLLRWDAAMGEVNDGILVNRFTYGVAFGFSPTVMKTELRLSYEQFNLKDGYQNLYFSENAKEGWYDKVLLELFIRF